MKNDYGCAHGCVHDYGVTLALNSFASGQQSAFGHAKNPYVIRKIGVMQ